MSLLSKLLGHHRYDDWAADSSFMAARILNQVACDVIITTEGEISQASWREGIFSPSAFINHRIAPLVREVAEPAAIAIIEEANLALRELVEFEAVWVRSPEHVEADGGMFDGVSDIASATVPLAAGVAAAVSIPSAAFTTTTAFFGLVTATAISWPVVLGGSAVAGLGVATGVLNSAKLWDKTAARLRTRARRFVIEALIEGTPDRPSILQQIAAEFERTSEMAKLR